MPSPLLILGLDGFDVHLFSKYQAANRCPNLAALRQRSAHTTFLPIYPVVSPAIWNSYFTGLNPLEHGLIDLMRLKDGQLQPCSALDRRVPTIFAQLASLGFNVAAIGFPGTYPAETEATIISGFDAPWATKADQRAFSNKKLQEKINQLGGWSYQTINEFLAIGDSSKMAATLIKQLAADLNQKEKILTALFQAKKWDLFAFHLQTLDTAAHHLWHLDDPDSPLHPSRLPGSDYLGQVYELVDNFVGRFLDLAGPDIQIMVLSDHGMGGASGTVIHLNSLLAEAGLLSFKNNHRFSFANCSKMVISHLPNWTRYLAYRLPVPKKLLQKAAQSSLNVAVDMTRTKVWAQEIDASPALFINLASKQPFGIVRPEELPALEKQLTRLFSNLKDISTDELLFSDLLPATQLGNNIVDYAADYYPIYRFNKHGYRASVVSSTPQGAILNNQTKAAGKGQGMPGVHKGGGIFWLASPETAPGPCRPLNVMEVTKKISALLNVELPSEYASNPEQPLDNNVIEALTSQLRRFGYID